MISTPIHLTSILSNERSDDSVIAWRGSKRFILQEFRLTIARLASQLMQSSNKRWALYFEDSYYFAIALLALLYSGKIPVLLGHLRPVLLAEQESEFDAVITDTVINVITKPILHIDEFATDTFCDLPAWPKQQYLILFTSGSTGKPKPIYKSIDLLELEGQLLISSLLYRWQVKRLIATVSHQHLYGLTFRILLPLLAGIAFDAKSVQYHEQLQNYPEDILLVASPAFLKRLDIKLSPKKYLAVLSAGGPLSYEEAVKVRQCLGVLPQEIYGSSETGIIATRQQQQAQQVWQSFSGIEVKPQVDSTAIYSPLCELSPTIIPDSIQCTTDGFLLLGRQCRVIKVEEKRVSLLEVEERLKALPEVADAAVVILQQGHTTLLGAILVLTPVGQSKLVELNNHLMFQSLRLRLKDFLDSVAVPKKWRIANELPYNSQGKVLYSELQEFFE